MNKINKVPNGPLVKKKGPFKGSTLKAGGVIKKAQAGTAIDKTSVAKTKVRGTIKNQPFFIYADKVTTPTKKDSVDYKKGYDFGQEQPKNKLQRIFENPAWSVGNLEGRDDKRPKKKISMKAGGVIKKAQFGVKIDNTSTGPKKNYSKDLSGEKILTAKKNRSYESSLKNKATQKRKEATNANMLSTELMMSDNNFNRSKIADKLASERIKSADSLTTLAEKNKVNPKYKSALKTGGKVTKAKAGGMIKRADGSMSKRGLWDNIRANKGSGKKPTAAMLKQEKKIKSKK